MSARRNAIFVRAAGAAVAAGVLMLSVLVPVHPASAAPGELDTSVQWVSNPALAPVTELRASFDNRNDGVGSLVGLQVGYSCGGTTDCVNTVITIDPMPLDPYYGTHRFASFSSTTLPPGAVYTGNATAGYTIRLGTVASGTSASFTMLYNYQARPVGVSPQSFFPDGSTITASATISASDMDPVTNSSSVVWRIDTPEPAVKFADTPVARAGMEYTYTLYMSARCLWERSTAGHGEPVYECAESYTAIHTLPVGAEFRSASHGGAYDAASGTVTWADSGASAATGWGALGNLGQPRTVTVLFPESMFTDPEECVISATTQLEVDMIYLSGVRDSATTSTTNEVNACTPFASATLEKITTRNTGTSADPIVWEASANYWTARVTHRSNVPGIATIVDENLDHAGLTVYRIALPHGPGTISVVLDNGDTATVTATTYAAPTGRRIVSATVTSGLLLGPNKVESSQPESTIYDVRFQYTVDEGVPVEGYQRTNTVTATIEFPGTPELSEFDLGAASATVTVYQRPAVLTPRITRTVDGGGNPVPGTTVRYSLSADTSFQKPDVPFEPQYVFVAPARWTIIFGSAELQGVPDAVIEYKTVTIDGVTRQAVFVMRPEGTVWGVNETWPTLNVQATPTVFATASTVSRAHFYMGDAAHNYGATTALWGANNGARYVDVADLDGDGDTTESFAWASVDTVVGASSALNVVKEICLPDAAAADGCEWLSDATTPVGVAPTTTDISYRVTMVNGGSTTLSGVVAYDILPYLGDTGTGESSASTPRGSTFEERLNSLQSASPNLSIQFSDSTNPCRPEVYPAAPLCVDDWSSSAADARAIRATLTGDLSAGQSVSFVYSAAVVGSPEADAIACNSVAADSATTPPTEPQPVCALIESADLAISVPDRLPLQAGRPGVLPFEVTNVSGTAQAPGVVSVDLPSGLTLTSLSIDGWECASPSGAAPLAGPARVDCTPIDEFLTERKFAVGVTELLELPVTPQTAVESLCVPAAVAGALEDPQLDNNDTSACFTVFAGLPALEIGKDDGRTVVTVGDEYTYTIRLANLLVGETVADITVTDELPDGLVFVSASDGGTVSGQNTDDGFGNLTGGVVTWTVPSISSSGSLSADGTVGTGAAASTAELTVTVRVAPSAAGSIENTVIAAAADPSDPAVVLEARASDIDDVRAAVGPTVTKVVDSLAQDDDGTWTIVYRIDVVNPNAQVPVKYSLTDSIVFGPGIVTSAASVTSAPAGVATVAWSGSGAIASDVVLSAASTHVYRVAVNADAQSTPGTPAAQCRVAEAVGFTNTASLDFDGGFAGASACASPVEPSIEKSVVGDPVQNSDGTWTVSYRLTVSNPHPRPAAGLSYTLDDALQFPAGIDVRAVRVSTVAGGAAPNTAFTGGLSTIAGRPVTADAAVLDGVGRIAAGTASSPAVHEYQVDVAIMAAEGSVAAADVVCGVSGAGYGNWVTLFAGSSATPLGQATACADIRLPELRFTKAADTSVARLGETITYTITAENVGDAAFTDADPAQLADDMSGLLDDARYNSDAFAAAGTVVDSSSGLEWSGPIPAGESVTIRYTVSVFSAERGDGVLVNVVARPDASVPPADVAACETEPRDNADYCSVTVQLDTTRLASTGSEAGFAAIGAFGGLMIVLGVVLIARRRSA